MEKTATAMSFCAICQSIDFRWLLTTCVLQCQERQKAEKSDEYVYRPRHEPSLRPEQHDDIFHVEETAKKGCGLCRIIFQAFKRRNVTNEQEARGLRIGFRTVGNNKIEVCYDSDLGLIKLCGLDIYMSEAKVIEVFQRDQIKEDDSPPILRMMQDNPKSQACLEVASHWLRDCSENHDSCNPLTESQIKPKRLIDIGDGSREPSLVDTTTLPKNIKWLALSYCWGEEPSLKLTRDNIGMLRSGIAMDKLDPTIQDAIFVTRALGIPYIWIDSLCIIQGPGAEWQEQAGKMNEVYGGSTVTLVVASSKTVKQGFLKDRQTQYIPIKSFSGDVSNITNSSDVYLSLEWDENEDSADGPWSSRGWTMQEGLLPNRLLYYTSSQMIWKCREEERFERGVRRSFNNLLDICYGLDQILSFWYDWFGDLEMFLKFKNFEGCLPRIKGTPPSSDPSIFRLWYEIIEVYSTRQFKDISDRLVAISSIAKVFGSMIQCGDYVAGLWEPDLVRGLTWRTQCASFNPRFSSTRTANNIFPSWSWASIGYESVIIDRNSSDFIFKYRDLLSEVKKVHIDLVDRSQPFGMIKSASITIAGPLKRLPILYNKAWRSTDESMSRLERYISEKLEMESSGTVNPRYSSPPGGHFAVLQMLHTHSSLDLLVLEATGGVTNGVYTYWRVGALTLPRVCMTDVPAPEAFAYARMHGLIGTDSLKVRLGPQPKKPQPKEPQQPENAGIHRL